LVTILSYVLNLAAWQAERFLNMGVWICTVLGPPTATSSYSLKREVVIMSMIVMMTMMMAAVIIIIVILTDFCSQ